MVDVICFDDLDEFGGELDDPLEELGQDLYHRLIEPPGSNLDDPDRGLGLEERLSGPIKPSLKAEIEAELRKDDRVQAVQASITQTAADEYAVDIQVEANEGVLGIKLVKDGNGVRRIQ
jgi:hypothetical protein